MDPDCSPYLFFFLLKKFQKKFSTLIFKSKKLFSYTGTYLTMYFFNVHKNGQVGSGWIRN
jgi:hypothetical protein